MKDKKCLCGKDPLWERKNEGRAYCRRCFLRQMESTVKHGIRRSGVCGGDRILIVSYCDAPSAMLKKIFEKSLGRNPGIKITERKMKNPGKEPEISGDMVFTKICLPETSDDMASAFLRNLSEGRVSFKNKSNVIRPLSGISLEEAELYCRILGIRHKKRENKDPFLDFIKKLDSRYPGLRNQAARFYEKISY